MKKVWEAMALFIVLIIFINIVSTALEPFLPLIGIVVSFLIVMTVVVLGIRLINKRKFW